MYIYIHTHTHTHTYIYCKNPFAVCVHTYTSVQAYLILLCFAFFVVCRRCNFYKLKVYNRASLSAPFFQQHLLISGLFVTFW